MTVYKLPSGNWRAQVYNPATRGNVGVGTVLGGKSTFGSQREAKAARAEARKLVGTAAPSVLTVGEWWHTWTTSPLYDRPKASTMIRYREQTKQFAREHHSLPLAAVGDTIVARWLAGGKRNSQVPGLRVMFNDAASAKAGRLIASNPWAALGLSKGPGRRHLQPPSEAEVWEIIASARKHSMPSFAAWLQVAAFTGMRPGELDALRWDAVDFSAGTIRVREQYSANARTFTTPKNGRQRDAILTPPAREALVALPRESEWCFTTIRGTHFTPSSRFYHWKATKAGSGWTQTLYLATRHHFGWYAINVLGLSTEDVAVALGHTDGGILVAQLYGHLDTALALGRVRAAFENRSNVTPLRAVRGDSG